MSYQILQRLSSASRTLAKHVRGTLINTRILHKINFLLFPRFFANCSLSNSKSRLVLFRVAGSGGICSSGRALTYSCELYQTQYSDSSFLRLFSMLFGNYNLIYRKSLLKTQKISPSGRALALHARGTGIDTRILRQIGFLIFTRFFANCFAGN